MSKLTLFFRQDNKISKKLILLLFCLCFGTYKIFSQETGQVLSIMLSVFFYLAAILLARDIILQLKAYRKRDTAK
ncbi:hypothetical protein NCCP2222_00470 [Sporosarcina sp. NCCP-2222]|nr:hypothetical protein NCCP2222_00470 [Sporosarcina sp. NCCP-2222]